MTVKAIPVMMPRAFVLRWFFISMGFLQIGNSRIIPTEMNCYLKFSIQIVSQNIVNSRIVTHNKMAVKTLPNSSILGSLMNLESTKMTFWTYFPKEDLEILKIIFALCIVKIIFINFSLILLLATLHEFSMFWDTI